MKLASAKLYQLTLLCSALLCVVPTAAFAADSASDSSETRNEGESEGSKESSKEDDDAATDGKDASQKTDKKDGKEKDEPEKKNNISIYLDLSASADQGSFAPGGSRRPDGDNSKDKPTYYDYQGVTLDLYAQLTYARESHRLSLGINGTQYLIGGSNKPYEFLLSDLSLGYKSPRHTFESINATVGLNAGLGFPTSKRSQYAKLILGANATGFVSFNLLDSLDLSFSIKGTKLFHRYKSQVAENQADEKGIPTIVARPDEYLGGNLISVGGLLTEWLVQGSVGLDWSLWNLGFSTGYTFRQSWSYFDDKMTDDSCSSLPSDEYGRKVNSCVSGRAIGQVIMASFTISYDLAKTEVEWLNGFGVYLRASTFQTPLTTDNKSYSFPFWNFQGAAGNYSQVILGVSYGHGWGF